MINNQKGFTLAESLIVLSIFMILSLVTAISLKPQHAVLEDAAFFTQLKADLYYAQNYAISHQHDVSVVFIPSEYKYYMFLRTEVPPIVERTYSNNINLTVGTLPLYFKFLQDGNVNKFGSLVIHTQKNDYLLTVLIGKGRFYVTEK
ncbi:competence type IV pilus minor pilin ComGD [Paenibacillus sp. BSR1-1]|uniref:competence type IV pilus minor pilin ComGD n=1 Tax=Paenibacillus sp. BSR1-1 TaxID=3020845 RepID=UPI0025B0188A|nr:competence type IV pilus minor pilin ComGD [Paenibacillus sp. BSR1-1]MDN3016521.1 competence type IV pilus minor pilin ComGD [Paenibacillus sp. BSR1-1]